MAGRADLCALGRVHLYDPMWTLHAAVEQDYDGPGAVWPMPWRAGRRKPQTGRSDGPKPRLELIRSPRVGVRAPPVAAGSLRTSRSPARSCGDGWRGRSRSTAAVAGARLRSAAQRDPAVGDGDRDQVAGCASYAATVPRNRRGRSMVPTSSRSDASAVATSTRAAAVGAGCRRARRPRHRRRSAAVREPAYVGDLRSAERRLDLDRAGELRGHPMLLPRWCRSSSPAGRRHLRIASLWRAVRGRARIGASSGHDRGALPTAGPHPVRSRAAVASVMSPLGFSSYSLWMVVIEDDRPVPQIMEIVEAAEAPGEEDAVAFARVLEHLAEPGLRFAFLRSRPGGGRPDAATGPGRGRSTRPVADPGQPSTSSISPTTTTCSRSPSTTSWPSRPEPRVGGVPSSTGSPEAGARERRNGYGGGASMASVSGGTAMALRRTLAGLLAVPALVLPALLAGCGDDSSVADPPVPARPTPRRPATRRRTRAPSTSSAAGPRPRSRWRTPARRRLPSLSKDVEACVMHRLATCRAVSTQLAASSTGAAGRITRIERASNGRATPLQ